MIRKNAFARLMAVLAVGRPLCFANKATEQQALEEMPFVANEYSPDTGEVLLAPYGNWPHSKGLQKFELPDAQAIVADFSNTANKGVRAVGIPFYVGHPDHSAFKGEPGHTDTRAYGRIKSLRAGPEGLFGNVEWNDLGKAAINGKMFHGHSVNWRMRQDGRAFRPVSLKSVGLTNEPNIQTAPITVANEDQNNMNKLAKIYGLPETATAEEIEAKATEMANSVAATQAVLVAMKKSAGLPETAKDAELQAKMTEMANTITTTGTELANSKVKVTELEGKVGTLTTEKTAAETNFANARTAHTKLLLDAAEKDGRVTPAQRKEWETNFANAATFEETVTKLAATKPVLRTASQVAATNDQNQNRMLTQQQRIAKTQEFVNQKMAANKGMSYDTAWALVQQEQAAHFANMEQPEHAKAQS